MKPYYQDKWVTIYHGDCREPTFANVSAIVTDPPYELGFMGKTWDSKGISFQKETWGHLRGFCLSGAPLLSFGGTRTFHRIACAIEDAGWEIRDTLMWVYGSGFPKSLDISKAIDKINGETGRLLRFVEWMRTTGLKAAEINEAIGKSDVGSHYLRRDQPAIPTRELWARLRPLCLDVPAWVDELVERIEAEREIIGEHIAPDGKPYSERQPRAWTPQFSDYKVENADTPYITAPATPEAQLWEGYGTALKPAYEPILLCMNPLDGTFAENALKHKVAGLNIDECRIEYEKAGNIASNPLLRKESGARITHGADLNSSSYSLKKSSGEMNINSKGRFPANFIHDGSQMVMELFPNSKTGDLKRVNSSIGGNGIYQGGLGGERNHQGSNGSAARFFYCAKASKAERDRGCEGMPEKASSSMPGRRDPYDAEWDTGNDVTTRFVTSRRNNHPTVKPLSLMEYLCKLVKMPEYNLVLDPFCGSGTTLLACIKLEIPCIGIDNDEHSCEIAARRCCQEVMDLSGDGHG